MAHKLSDPDFRNDIDGIIRNLNGMSNDDLKGLVECDDAIIDSQFTDCAAARVMERTRQSLLENNRLIAQENISRESEFFELRNKLLTMYQEAKDLKKSIDEIQDSRPALKQQSSTDLNTIQALLEAAARDAEDVSEKIVSDFLSQSIPADEFLSTFLDKRRNWHLKRVQAEKVVELLQQARHRAPEYPPLPTMPQYPMPPQYAPNGVNPPYLPPMMPPMMGHMSMPLHHHNLPYPYGPPGGPMSMPTPGT